MHLSKIQESPDAPRFSHSPSTLPSTGEPQWLVSSSSQSPTLHYEHTNLTPMCSYNPFPSQSNVMVQTDVQASQPPSEMFDDSLVSSPPKACMRPVSPSVTGNTLSSRIPFSRVLKGQNLLGEHSVYDIDKQHPGEGPAQLEVFPISVYGRDPALVAGRQIAVNRRYICYCFRPGSIRILSRNVPIRALFEGHSQRVTDMAFFAENVHLVGSASSDGWVLVWKIVEVQGTDDKLQLLEETVLAIQFLGQWEDACPRVCWHPYSQECLLIGINKYLLRVDFSEVRKAFPAGFTVENPVKCHVTNCINGVQCFGIHDNEVTDLSVIWRDSLFVASASMDGTVRIWEEKKLVPVAVLEPHGGQAVNSVAFISSPNNPGCIVLLTGGPLNHSLKLWVSANARGSLNSGLWHSIQTLELKSSAEGKLEQAFLNQVCVVPLAGLILLGNTKKHAMYSVHFEFGDHSAATRLDYLVEFSMAMPILSLTAMAETIVNERGIVQVFCVQTQAIHQYFLNVSLCIPPYEEEASALQQSVLPSGSNPIITSEQNVPPDSSSGFGSWVEVPNWVADSLKRPSRTGSASTNRDTKVTVSKDATSMHPRSPLAPDSRTSAAVLIKHSEPGNSSHSNLDYSLASCHTSVNIESKPASLMQNTDHVGIKIDSEKNVLKFSSVGPGLQPLSSIPNIENSKTMEDGEPEFQINDSEFQCDLTKTTLAAPSELMNRTAQGISKVNLNLSLPAGEVDGDKHERSENATSILHFECSQSNIEVTMGSCQSQSHTAAANVTEDETLTTYYPVLYGAKNMAHIPRERTSELEENQTSHQFEESENQVSSLLEVASGQREELHQKIQCPLFPVTSHSVTNTKRRKSKNKSKAKVSNTSSETVLFTIPTVSSLSFEDTDSTVPVAERKLSASPAAVFDNLSVKILSLQESFDHLVAMQRDLQRHISVAVEVPMAKEAKRVESVLMKSLETTFKSRVDGLCTWIEEDNEKRDRLQLELIQQLLNLIPNFVDKEATSGLDQLVKKEVSSFGPRIARLGIPDIESTVTVAVHDDFQGLCQKGFGQLENSVVARLDGVASYQLQNHLKNSGRHLLQDGLSPLFMDVVVPSFETSCNEMVEQVNAYLHERMIEYAFYMEQQLASSCIPLATTLKDKMADSSLAMDSLKGEIAEGKNDAFALF
eukprot:c28961_g1_i2 orf=819-4334(+)